MDQLVDKFELITGVPFLILFQMCLIIALETIGLVQLLKNFIKCKKCRDKECSKCISKKLTFTSIIVCLICAIMNTTLVHPIMTRIFDFFMLSLAIVQMAHDTIIKALPRALNAVVDRTLSIKTTPED